MKLKTIIDSPCGLRYYFEELPISSGFSRRLLLETEAYTSADDIEKAYEELRACKDEDYSTLQFKLQYLKDIRGSISRVASKLPLDDIELFEIKNFALLSCEISKMITDSAFSILPPVDLEEVVDILDPDHLRISSFYIYDSYSLELSALRLNLKKELNKEAKEEIENKIEVLESIIRKELSMKLFEYKDDLSNALERVARIDILVAKVISAKTHSYIIPELSFDAITSYIGLFNPQVVSLVEGQGREYQKVDVSFGLLPTLIVGANMGGKTVILKTLALCQYLLLFTFPIPAKSAKIAFKKEVFLSIGDLQSEIDGLSSFGAEIKSIDRLIQQTKQGADYAIFIDEPARSTNPIEGTALVESMITILGKYSSSPVITTHYNIDLPSCNRMKVVGMENGKMNYSLTEAPSGMVPHEAIMVAKSMNVDNQWLEEAEKILNER